MLSMFAGAQCVHQYYKPLSDLDAYVEEERLGIVYLSPRSRFSSGIPGEWLGLSLALACHCPRCCSWLVPFKPPFVALFQLTSPVLYQTPTLLYWVLPWPVSAEPNHTPVLTQWRQLIPVAMPSPCGRFRLAEISTTRRASATWLRVPLQFAPCSGYVGRQLGASLFDNSTTQAPRVTAVV
ncbi:hypothetical protein MRX96_013889 [Rhipicephalus microplus]